MNAVQQSPAAEPVQPASRVEYVAVMSSDEHSALLASLAMAAFYAKLGLDSCAVLRDELRPQVYAGLLAHHVKIAEDVHAAHAVMSRAVMHTVSPQ